MPDGMGMEDHFGGGFWNVTWKLKLLVEYWLIFVILCNIDYLLIWIFIYFFKLFSWVLTIIKNLRKRVRWF